MASDEEAAHRAVLGVGPDASADAIRAAYRRRSRSAHPDAGGRDDEFRRVRRAYEALTEAPPLRAPTGGDGADLDARPQRGAAPAAPAPPAAARPTTAPTAVGPARPSSGRVGCLVASVLAATAVIGIGVLVAVLASSSGSKEGADRQGPRPSGTAAGSYEQWRAAHQALVTAIVSNGGDIGAALSSPGGVALGPLQDACARRSRLLDELEAAAPMPREDVTRAIAGFVSSERRAMAACSTSPPDLDGLATWGERGQPDLRIIVQATQP